MLTRDEQLRVKAAQFGDGEGKPARGRGRGRGCKATKQNNTKQSKKQGSAAKPASSGGADAWEPEWEETEWGEDDWARYSGATGCSYEKQVQAYGKGSSWGSCFRACN